MAGVMGERGGAEQQKDQNNPHHHRRPTPILQRLRFCAAAAPFFERCSQAWSAGPKPHQPNAQHSAVNETLCPRPRTLLKQSRPKVRSVTPKGKAKCAL